MHSSAGENPARRWIHHRISQTFGGIDAYGAGLKVPSAYRVT
jgi:hypothetical protein